MNKRLILKLTGSVLLVEGALLFVPLIISLILRESVWIAFAMSIGITIAVGAVLVQLRPRDDVINILHFESSSNTGLSLFGLTNFAFDS